MKPKKKKKMDILVIVIGIILYAAGFFLSMYMSATFGRASGQALGAAKEAVGQLAAAGGNPQAANDAIDRMASVGSSNAYNGVIAQVQVLVSVVMVLLARKKGFITGAVLNGVSGAHTLLLQVIARHNMNALPGAVISFITIVIIFILFYHVDKNDKATEELNESYQKAIEQARLLQDKDESLRFLAYYDKLTSMPNRELFMENINDRISESRMTTLVYIDIDNFRYINDTFGHNLGDDLLVRYAEKITNLCGDEIFVAKIGGDEYGIILDEKYSSDEVMAFVGELARIFSEPINIRGDVFSVTASFGAATFPNDTRSAEDLFRCAETAMFSAKANGKNQLCFYRA